MHRKECKNCLSSGDLAPTDFFTALDFSVSHIAIMHRNLLHVRCRSPRKGVFFSVRRFSTHPGLFTQQETFLATKPSHSIQQIEVPHLSYASKPDHVSKVAQQLRQRGILKATLRFPDPASDYLKQLVSNLHQHHGHQLPIRHNTYQGAFWDVRPNSIDFQAKTCQARSETMNEFPWHTDCSYEDHPPRYFALHVLQHDRYGGGTLSLMNVKGLCNHLSPTALVSLSRPEYLIKVPPEFAKDPSRRSIPGCILAVSHDSGDISIRFRKDIMSALTPRAAHALEELDQLLQDRSIQASLSLHLHPKDLPEGSIILVDNRRWLHARNHIRDPERHLRRIRWDAAPFERVGS